MEEKKYRCWCRFDHVLREYDARDERCYRCRAKCLVQDDLEVLKIKKTSEIKWFLRDAWIHLARTDAPLDVFDHDFKIVGEIEYQVIVDTITVDIPYSVSVGHPYQESYTEMETRYEREPYKVWRDEWDYYLKKYVYRDHTEYREVKKEYPVTKYRTKMQWFNKSSKLYRESTVCIRNPSDILFTCFCGDEATVPGKASNLSNSRFYESVIDFSPVEFKNQITGGAVFTNPSEDELEYMKISPSTMREVCETHRKTIDNNLEYDIEQDSRDTRFRDTQFKDLEYGFNINKSFTKLYLVPEYFATINYGGRDYTIKTLPFGNGHWNFVSGEIPNSAGEKSYMNARQALLSSDEKEIKGSHEKDKWYRCKNLMIVAAVLFALSMAGLLVVGSLSILYYALEPELGYPFYLLVLLGVFILMFVAGFIVYIVSAIHVHVVSKRIDSSEDEKLRSTSDSAQSDMDEFKKTYKSRQLVLLNKKLESLGYEPATISEIGGVEEW